MIFKMVFENHIFRAIRDVKKVCVEKINFSARSENIFGVLEFLI